MNNTGQITGAFDIDFDRQMLSGVQIMNGWKAYGMEDISNAVCCAYRDSSLSEDARWSLFLEQLIGRELTNPLPYMTAGSRRLSDGDISFWDEIMEANGKLNFYMNTSFPVDEVFGTHVETSENDDWINVYANYDIVQGQVCDTLDIVLNRGDGSCEELACRLDDREMTLLLEKMQGYCMKQEGLTLEDLCLLLREEAELLTGQNAQQM